MIIIVCLDDDNGMMFNHRRQSRDREVIEDILKAADGRPIRMSPYSRKLFPEDIDGILCSEDFLKEAENGDLCFVEDADITPVVDQIEVLVIFHWNRKYPADRFFPLDIEEEEWELESSEEFAGFSHDCIRRKIYSRR